MKKDIMADIAIIGGGVAGLWLLNRLRQRGLSVVLLESQTLGGGQTNKSQGIIHGGIKYALQAKMTKAASAISGMPKQWEACLKGEGDIDLREVPILSPYQYLWTTDGLTKIAGFFASFALKSNVRLLTREDFPPVFQHPAFKGTVYSLDEMVIDVNALIRELTKPHQDVIFKINPIQEEQINIDEKGQLTSIEIHAEPMMPLTLKAQKYIFAAGSGNEVFLRKINALDLSMQERPLHMVMVKHDFDYSLYAHCLGFDAIPRLTVTTHRTQDEKTIWYLGGQLAETGITRDEEQQVMAARQELADLFSWMNFENATFSSFFINRAEALQPNGKRPDACYMKEVQNMIVVWPTKLAFVPLLSNEVLYCIEEEKIKAGDADLRALRAWPIPALATPIWDEMM